MSDQEALEAEEKVSEHAAEEDSQADKASAADEDLEVVELELSDDDIVRYLEDDQGNRIGFVIMEDGEEAEYLYVEGDEDWGFAGFAAQCKGYKNGSLAVQDMINGNIKYVIIDSAPAKCISDAFNELG